jgi:hypothetical protein
VLTCGLLGQSKWNTHVQDDKESEQDRDKANIKKGKIEKQI